jgi:hypothetical protein
VFAVKVRCDVDKKSFLKRGQHRRLEKLHIGRETSAGNQAKIASGFITQKYTNKLSLQPGEDTEKRQLRQLNPLVFDLNGDWQGNPEGRAADTKTPGADAGSVSHLANAVSIGGRFSRTDRLTMMKLAAFKSK